MGFLGAVFCDPAGHPSESSLHSLASDRDTDNLAEYCVLRGYQRAEDLPIRVASALEAAHDGLWA